MADQAFVIYRMVVQAAGGDAARRAAARLHARPRGDRGGGHAATRLVFLAQPEQSRPARSSGAPHGRASSRAVPPDVVVVADDAYAEYVEDPDYPDTIADRSDGTACWSRCGRSRSSTGWRACASATASAPRELVDERCDRIRQPFNVNCARARRRARGARRRRARRAHAARSTATAWRISSASSQRLGLPLRAERGELRPRARRRRRRGLRGAAPPRRHRAARWTATASREHLRVTIGTAEENQRFVDALEAALR